MKNGPYYWPNVGAHPSRRATRAEHKDTRDMLPGDCVTRMPSSCTGNCNQGRACDCAPDYPIEFDDSPRGSGAGVLLWPLSGVALALIAWWLV